MSKTNITEEEIKEKSPFASDSALNYAVDNNIPIQTASGQTVDPVLWAIENGWKIHQSDPLSWAIMENKPIAGRDPYEYAIENTLLVTPLSISFNAIEIAYSRKSPEEFARFCDKIEGQSYPPEIRKYITEGLQAAEETKIKDQKIYNQFVESGGKRTTAITNLPYDPTVQAIKKGFTADGKDPLLWAAENGVKIQGQDPIAWAQKNNKQIDSLDPIMWAVENKKQIEGKDPFLYAYENQLMIKEGGTHKHPIDLAREYKSPREFREFYKRVEADRNTDPSTVSTSQAPILQKKADYINSSLEFKERYESERREVLNEKILPAIEDVISQAISNNGKVNIYDLAMAIYSVIEQDKKSTGIYNKVSGKEVQALAIETVDFVNQIADKEISIGDKIKYGLAKVCDKLRLSDWSDALKEKIDEKALHKLEALDRIKAQGKDLVRGLVSEGKIAKGNDLKDIKPLINTQSTKAQDKGAAR